MKRWEDKTKKKESIDINLAMNKNLQSTPVKRKQQEKSNHEKEIGYTFSFYGNGTEISKISYSSSFDSKQ